MTALMNKFLDEVRVPEVSRVLSSTKDTSVTVLSSSRAMVCVQAPVFRSQNFAELLPAVTAEALLLLTAHCC